MKEIIKACENGELYDYIANNYYAITREDLKEVILSMLGVIYDKNGDNDYIAFNKLVGEEYKERNYEE